MKNQSPLQEIHKKGIYGDCDNKNEQDLLKVKEVSNLKILQIAKYKNLNFIELIEWIINDASINR